MPKLNNFKKKHKNAYSYEAKDDVRDRIEVEVGDIMQDDFMPQIKLKRWDNEVNLSVRLKENMHGAITLDGAGDIVTLADDKKSVKFYNVSKDISKYHDPTFVRVVRNYGVAPERFLSTYEFNKNVRGNKSQIAFISVVDRPMLFLLGSSNLVSDFYYEDIRLPVYRLLTGFSSNPMYIDKGMVMLSIEHSRAEDIRHAFMDNVAKGLLAYGFESKHFRVSRSKKLLYKEKKIVSTSIEDNLFGAYVNFDCEYNKSMELYRAGVKYDSQDEVGTTYGKLHSINADIPQEKFVEHVVFETLSALGIQHKISKLTVAEERAVEAKEKIAISDEWRKDMVRKDKLGMHDTEGFEFELELQKPPESGIFRFTIQTKGLDFFYQPALTSEEKSKGLHRPYDVEGSYAVYHKKRKGNIIGGKDYKTGKAFHIYRPYAEDANGDREWGHLTVDEKNGELKMEFSKEWLDSAAYPVRVDPTFGYTSVGASSADMSSQYTSFGSAQQYAVGSGFDLDSISMYVSQPSGGFAIKAALYDDNGSNTPNNRLALGTVTVSTTAAWKTKTLVSNGNLTGNYWVHWSEDANGDAYIGRGQIYYDTVSSGTLYTASDNDDAYVMNGDPWGGTNGINTVTMQYSIYATYTAGSTAYTKNLTESITLVDTKTIQTQKSFNEVIIVLDTIAKKSAKVFTENITLSTAIAKQIAHTFVEAITLADSITNQTSRLFTESITLADTIAKTMVRSLTEAITLTDTLTRQTQRIFTETVTLADSIAKQAQKSFVEAITLVDSILTQATLFKVLTEAVALTDSIKKQLSRSFSETITLTDVLSKIGTFFKSLVEAVTLTDSLSKKPVKSFTESVSLSDTITKQTAHAFVEVVTLTDTVTRQINRTFTEVVTLADNITTQVARVFIETIALTDTLSRQIGKSFTETIVLADTLRKQTQKSFTESVTLADAINTLTVFGRVFTETVTLTATLTVKTLMSKGKIVLLTIADKSITAIRNTSKAILRTIKDDKNIVKLKSTDKAILPSKNKDQTIL